MLVARFPQETSQEDFNRNWDDYKKGFGDPAKEHWIGNDYIRLVSEMRSVPFNLHNIYSFKRKRQPF